MSPRVEICFVSGFERDWRPPAGLPVDHLGHRIAVVQDSFVPDAVDMHFDEPLLLAVIEFVRRTAPGADVAVAPDLRDIRRAWTPLAVWLADRNRLAPEDRSAPAAIRATIDGRTPVCVVTEFWNRVGGPRPYHDSWTYSVLSERDLSSDLPAFLAGLQQASGWTVIPAVLDEPVFPARSPPGPFERLFRLFR